MTTAKVLYSGERTVVISWADNFANRPPCSEVGADMMQKAGLNVDFQLMDTGTAVQRLHSKGSVDQGGLELLFPRLGWPIFARSRSKPLCARYRRPGPCWMGN
jgi:hypothetical protein